MKTIQAEYERLRASLSLDRTVWERETWAQSQSLLASHQDFAASLLFDSHQKKRDLGQKVEKFSFDSALTSVSPEKLWSWDAGALAEINAEEWSHLKELACPSHPNIDLEWTCLPVCQVDESYGWSRRIAGGRVFIWAKTPRNLTGLAILAHESGHAQAYLRSNCNEGEVPSLEAEFRFLRDLACLSDSQIGTAATWLLRKKMTFYGPYSLALAYFEEALVSLHLPWTGERVTALYERALQRCFDAHFATTDRYSWIRLSHLFMSPIKFGTYPYAFAMSRLLT